MNTARSRVLGWMGVSGPAARQVARLVPVLLLVLGLVGCRSSGEGPDGEWLRAEVSVGSENFLLLICRNALNDQGFSVGAGLDADAMSVVSGWRTQLAPFRGQGVRHRAKLRCTQIDEGRWAVEVRVQAQVNMDIVRPTDLTYAEWEWRPDDQEQARVVLAQVRSLLGEPLELRSGGTGRR